MALISRLLINLIATWTCAFVAAMLATGPVRALGIMGPGFYNMGYFMVDLQAASVLAAVVGVEGIGLLCLPHKASVASLGVCSAATILAFGWLMAVLGGLQHDHRLDKYLMTIGVLSLSSALASLPAVLLRDVAVARLRHLRET